MFIPNFLASCLLARHQISRFNRPSDADTESLAPASNGTIPLVIDCLEEVIAWNNDSNPALPN